MEIGSPLRGLRPRPDILAFETTRRCSTVLRHREDAVPHPHNPLAGSGRDGKHPGTSPPFFHGTHTVANRRQLYKRSHTGTKHLIEEYIDSCLATLDTLLTLPLTASTPTSREILESLINTRQSFGRTALLLSGGATFGMNHIGVLKALLEASLLPRIISGASAGSIVAAVLCTRSDDEIPNILQEFSLGNLDVFEDGKNPESILHRVARFLKIGAWIDIKHLTGVMRELLGDITFQEAYNRTRRILSICVSSASVYELPRLLNYISAPNVLIWSAVAASCSVPLLFTASSILSKDPKTGLPVPWNPTPQRWIDGSVENDLPMTRLAEMFNVNHFIVSQVNPHVVPFLSKEDLISPEPPVPPDNSTVAGWGEMAVKLAMGEALHRMNVLAEIGIFKTGLTKARSVLSQKYSGDITIFPEIPYTDLPKMLKNPTPEFMLTASLRGQRATWPKLSRIRNHCAIELALDMAIHRLRTRVVFSPSQTDLRLGNYWRTTSSNRGYGASAVTSYAAAAAAASTLSSRPPGPRKRMRSHDPSTLASRGRRSGASSPVLSRSGSSHALRRARRASGAGLSSEDDNSCVTSRSRSVDTAPEAVANIGKRRMHHYRGPSAPPIVAAALRNYFPLARGSTAPTTTVVKRRERVVSRMTGAGEDVVVRAGIGRAKSAEELRFMA